MTKVTFDSNVWRKVSSPSKFPKDQELPTYAAISGGLTSGKIIGYVSETTLTTEQIKRDDRLQWLRDSAAITVEEKELDNGGIQILYKTANTVSPHVSPMVQAHLEDAFNLGIRILRSKRIGGPNTALLADKKYYLNYVSEAEYHTHNNRHGEVARELEGLAVGMANIKSFGKKYAPQGKPWIKGFAFVPDSMKSDVADLVAEWADGDAIATSVAHGVQYFCTNDFAGSSTRKGINSAMAPSNATVIAGKYGIAFVTPAELVKALSL